MDFMKKCIVIVNELSGNSQHVSFYNLAKVFGEGYDVDTLSILESTVIPDLTEYDRIVLCGGDGTLNTVINCKKKDDAEMYYCPFGTLNELATGNSQDKSYVLHDAGQAGDRFFSYVFACGIFTPLGYVVKNKSKKKYKALAYLSKVIGQYKVCRIGAKLTVDGREEEGDYTLIMAIDSPKCFGFKFNKMFKFDDGLLHLLTIKSPKHRGLLGKIEVFFPLFRAFFIGFKKPYQSKNMRFCEFKDANITLKEETAFCADGEKAVMSGSFDIKPIMLDNPLHIIAGSEIKKMADNLTD